MEQEAEAESGPSIDLLEHQDRELAHLLEPSDITYPLTFICGGRGSGKSETDYLQLFLRSERCVDQPFALFANTDAQLQTFMAIITEKLDAIGMQHVFETKAPPSWRKRWRREGIRVPPRRLRNLKMWIWEDGTHIFCGTLVNNSYTRAKSLDLQAALIEEATEPGVTRDAITTILGAVRCGLGKFVNGQSECRRRGHLHEVVVKFNVPLNDPSNYIYKYDEEMRAKERVREVQGLKPFYRIIESATLDNPHTGENYDARLRASLDERTYIEQTSGKLRRNTANLMYHTFSERNILDTLVYDPRRPLHMWFDWNATPAVAGFGHDLQWDEVPAPERAKGHSYFGIVGELFSDEDPLHTDQVAEALLAERGPSGMCVHCHHDIGTHIETVVGWLCRNCAWHIPNVSPRQHCSGKTLQSPLNTEAKRNYLNVPDNWRGLLRHRGMVHVYGDVNDGGGNASAVSGGSIKILRDMFGEALGDRVEFHFPTVNPLRKLRVLAVNRGFRAGDNIASVFMHSRCEAHITDFREVIPDPKTGEPLKVPKSPSQRRVGNDYWKRTDISDAWGYHWSYRHPVLIPRADALPMGQGDDYEGPFATGWAQP